ncbi:hypothetical protein GRI34_02785 [Erythrobacter aquimaris]|uniref:DUF2306 domain-containing protein n=1 Tax=Qipengyuania aquimaris TaxID=255984 RepID=A0A6I4THG5_9SPHN|nr:hypothetical protein [Qipengyuania aquimaris]MXO95345.1 hypothetical protein [Qipengyuania aquimaris]
MFGPDPIDLYDPTPYGPFAYYGHLLLGTVALLAASIAFFARKGSKRHRAAGFVFAAAVAITCLTSIAMLANVFIPPLLMAVFTAAYAVGGACLALQKGTTTVRTAEVALTVFEIAGVILFLRIALAAVQDGLIPAFGPVVIITIPLILLAGDLNWFLKAQDRTRLRTARHLNRMVWGFVVVLRAPLVELAAGGLPVPPQVVIAGPILLGCGMLWYFQRRYGTLKKA